MFKKLTRLAIIPYVYAAPPDGVISNALPNPIKGDSSISGLLDSLALWLVYFTAFIVPIFIIIGAFQMLTSAGNPEKFKAGQKTILYAIIGFVIVILAKAMTSVIKNALNVKGV